MDVAWAEGEVDAHQQEQEICPPPHAAVQLAGHAGQTDKQTDRQADRQTSRQTDKQTDRQADRQTSRQTDKQTDRQADRQTSRQGDKEKRRKNGQQREDGEDAGSERRRRKEDGIRTANDKDSSHQIARRKLFTEIEGDGQQLNRILFLRP
ncbi:hypothetical protein TRV_03349 [Trichophyton verrucosum HKI 0517]|uniref:Uncharacterized protein n=1 Tax=Trichophyton verrucosum (strain HKI 0517) TaxID=663202 RepID=D4D8B3_TRIVH|nr:uncharacterized protein TRV_03349 [Trichophyton verrucosum HKI 0517]EFE41932.1 hypothetical protein TRV_03349 [Trichophyton verrucosum HKI 0517]